MRNSQKLHFAHLLSILSCWALLLASGCSTPSGNASKPRIPEWDTHGPFALKLPKTVSWTSGKAQGFDAALPGYHLTGDIASFRMMPVTDKPPEKFVLAITTSPGQKPHLDHFRISFSGGHIECEPFNKRSPARISTRNLERNAFIYKPKENFFAFDVQESAVLVSFKPEAILMLGNETTISWIDWYRN